MKNKKLIWIFVVILVLIEQGIKLVINYRYLEADLAILQPWIHFKPIFNRDYSWFNSMLQLGIGKWTHIIIVAIMIILIFLFYKYLNKQLGTTCIMDTAFIFIFSGSICSLIDKVFWNGSLDYIAVKGLFTFDLKDVYTKVFIALILIMMLINHKGNREISDRVVIKDFIKFIMRK